MLKYVFWSRCVTCVNFKIILDQLIFPGLIFFPAQI